MNLAHSSTLKHYALSFVCAAALLSGIGCDETQKKETAVDVDTFLAGVVAAYCNQPVHCPVADDDRIIGGLITGAGTEHCTDTANRLLNRLAFGEWRAKVDAGVLRYDAQAAGECLARIQNECGFAAEDDFDQLCSSVFRGAVDIGGACESNEVCKPGLYCDDSSSDCGHCEAQVPAGEVCDDSNACAASDGAAFASCLSAEGSGDARCHDVLMGAAAAEGETCGPMNTGTYQRTMTVCAEGLWCDRAEDSETGTCRSPIAHGSPCENVYDDVCVFGDVCLPSESGGNTCQTFQVRFEAGEPCSLGEQSAVEAGYCSQWSGLFCENGTCQRAGDGTEGAQCAGTEALECDDCEWTRCNDGLTCDLATGLCAPPKATGASCDEDWECASNQCDTVCIDASVCGG